MATITLLQQNSCDPFNVIVVVYACLPTVVHASSASAFTDVCNTLQTILGSWYVPQISLTMFGGAPDYGRCIHPAESNSLLWLRNNKSRASLKGEWSTAPFAPSLVVTVVDDLKDVNTAIPVLASQEPNPMEKLIVFVRQPSDPVILSATESSLLCGNLTSSSILTRRQLFIIVPDSEHQVGPQFSIYAINCIKNTVMVAELKSPADVLTTEKHRSDLNNATLRILLQHDPSFSVFTRFLKTKSGRVEPLGGLFWEELGWFAREMNFTIQPVIGNGWIEQFPNGSLTGMGAQLLRDEADIIGAVSEYVPYRAAKLALGVPVMETEVEAYFKASTMELNSVYLAPFSTEVWLAMLVCFAVLLGLHSVVARVVQRFDNEGPFASIAERHGITWLVSIICQQGWHSEPRPTSLRIIFLCGLGLSLMLYLIFSSSVIAMFSVDVSMFTKLRHLPRHGFKLYTLRIAESSTHILSIVSEVDGVIDSNWKTVSMTEARDLIMNTRSAILAAENQLYQMSQRLPNHSDAEYCTWKSDVVVPGAGWHGGMYFQKGDPLRDVFRYKMVPWKERGLQFRLEKSYTNEANCHCLEEQTGLKRLGMKQVALAFNVYFLGLSISAIVFLLEYAFRPRIQWLP